MAEPPRFITLSNSAARLVEVWRRYRAMSDPACVLDLGCGTGGTALQVVRSSDTDTAVGLDIAQANIDQAVQEARACGLSHRVSFVCASYEDWRGGTFDATLSDSVLHLIAISDEALASRLAGDLVAGGLLIATMPTVSFGNHIRIALRWLWRKCPSSFDSALLAVASRMYRQLPAELLKDRLPYMRVLPVRFYDARFAAALATAGLERVAELEWPSPSIAKLRHRLLIFRRTA